MVLFYFFVFSTYIGLMLPRSPSSAAVLNHISSHFLVPLSDSSLICTVPAHSDSLFGQSLTCNILI